MNTDRIAWIEERIRKVLANGPKEPRVVQQLVKQHNSTASDFHRALNQLIASGAVEARGRHLHLIDTRPAKTLIEFRYDL